MSRKVAQTLCTIGVMAALGYLLNEAHVMLPFHHNIG